MSLSHPHRALVEVGGLAALYALYELSIVLSSLVGRPQPAEDE